MTTLCRADWPATGITTGYRGRSSPTEVALSSCIIARGEPATGFSREIFPEDWARFRSSVAGYLGDLFGNVDVGIGARLS